MTKQISGEHIQREELINYFDGSFAEDNGRARRLEEHLAECDDCVEKAKEIRKSAAAYLRWTAESHGEAYRQSVMASALEQAPNDPANQAWKEGLRRWKDKGAALQENTVRFVMDSAGKAARFLSEQVDAVKETGASLTLAAPGFRVQGAIPLRTRGGAPSKTGGTKAGALKADVTVEAGVVQVRVDRLPSGRDSILVMLIPFKSGEKPMVAALTDTTKPPLTAVFPEIHSGDYIVAFEPL